MQTFSLFLLSSIVANCPIVVKVRLHRENVMISLKCVYNKKNVLDK